MKASLFLICGSMIAASFISCNKSGHNPPPFSYHLQKPSGKYDSDPQVFMKSAIELDVTNITAKSVTLPLLQGWTANGMKTYYILTESSDYDDAIRLGVNYSPVMKYAIGSQGVQNVTLTNDGKIRFKGTVDFSTVRVVIAGSPNAFPPSTHVPGSIGDAEYSPMLVMPNGIVYNAPQVANNTGVQDRVLSIDYNKMTVKILISDGFYGGHEFFYHLVTDASDSVPASIENGIYAEKLKYLPSFGKNTLADKSALRGFALAGNGETGIDNPERQGLNSTIVDGGLEPINVFQQDPENDKVNSNYSPMWDAHVYFWTDAAIAAGQRKRIHSLDEVASLLASGSIISDPTAKNPPNPTIAGLKNDGLIINCPVIWQPLNSTGK